MLKHLMRLKNETPKTEGYEKFFGEHTIVHENIFMMQEINKFIVALSIPLHESFRAKATNPKFNPKKAVFIFDNFHKLIDLAGDCREKNIGNKVEIEYRDLFGSDDIIKRFHEFMNFDLVVKGVGVVIGNDDLHNEAKSKSHSHLNLVKLLQQSKWKDNEIKNIKYASIGIDDNWFPYLFSDAVWKYSRKDLNIEIPAI